MAGRRIVWSKNAEFIFRKIFYAFSINQIIIHLIWDCRQNPDDLGIDL